jgi:hypothetical protein
MNDSDNFYTEKLYPFQDGILNIVGRLSLPFYLTGGTALSRCYCHHRYSDDLVLFVNNDPQFGHYIDRIFSLLEEQQEKIGFTIDNSTVMKRESFAQIFLVRDGTVRLKIDFVNDVAAHYGEYVDDTVLGRIDSWRNILSNKIAALYRFEPKDIADIWQLAKHNSFSWENIFQEAASKELAVDPLTAADILKSMPASYLESIKWIHGVDLTLASQEIETIANDIILRRDNSPGLQGRIAIC